MIFSCPAKAFPPPSKPWWGLYSFAYGAQSDFGKIELEIDYARNYAGEDANIIEPIAPSEDYVIWQDAAAKLLLNEPFETTHWNNGAAYDAFNHILNPDEGGTADAILWNLTFDFDAARDVVEEGICKFTIVMTQESMLDDAFFQKVIPVVCISPFEPWVTGQIVALDYIQNRIAVEVPIPVA